MGNVYGYPGDIPPGGVLLHIQQPGACCPDPPSFSHAKPGTLSIQDSDWQRFVGVVQGAIHAMKDEKWTFLPMLLLPIAVLVPMLARSMFEDLPVLGQFFGLPLVLIALAGFFGSRYWVVTENQKQDAVILNSCEELSRSTGGQVTVQYRTMFVGMCKPKGAQPFRAIALSPAGVAIGMAAPVGQPMQVQIPEGATPGTVLQVQAPTGQMLQVQVPQGLLPGQTMQVQVPAPQPIVVQATVIQNP